MPMKDSSIKERIKTMGWALSLAFRMDKKKLILWFVFSSALSILPAVALSVNQSILSDITAFLSTGLGEFSLVARNILVLGLILTTTGMSKRINGDFLYMTMYDSYYRGMQETMMDFVQTVEIESLLKKDIKDEYNAIIVS